MAKTEQIEHSGVVLSKEQGIVRVAIEVNEACGSCASRKACAMGSGEQREISIYSVDADKFSIGERVVVATKRSMGAMAVVLCYVVPLVVMVVALILAHKFGCSEGISALIALGSLALYYATLATMHRYISKKITFTIIKR